ncbi:hypothetical protein GCM10027052_00080 [Parafrigoribacterium mesophilum]
MVELVETPNHNATAANNNPVPNSTIGYRTEIGDAQFRHLPRSINHDSTGMLSYPFIAVPQVGHALGGDTIDRRNGTRYATTLRKEPISRPKPPARIAGTSSRPAWR